LGVGPPLIIKTMSYRFIVEDRGEFCGLSRYRLADPQAK
jgi:hypothetical protein